MGGTLSLPTSYTERDLEGQELGGEDRLCMWGRGWDRPRI